MTSGLLEQLASGYSGHCDIFYMERGSYGYARSTKVLVLKLIYISEFLVYRDIRYIRPSRSRGVGGRGFIMAGVRSPVRSGLFFYRR